MNPSKVEFSVGIFVLIGIAAVAYLAIRLGAGSEVGGESHLIEARFMNSGGLNRGASVKLAGVTVGRVESVRIDAVDYSAIATLRVRTVIPLPTDTMASIKTAGLIGDKYVALSPGADEAQLQPGERITMTESAVDLESLIGKMAFGSVESEETNPSTP